MIPLDSMKHDTVTLTRTPYALSSVPLPSIPSPEQLEFGTEITLLIIPSHVNSRLKTFANSRGCVKILWCVYTHTLWDMDSEDTNPKPESFWIGLIHNVAYNRRPCSQHRVKIQTYIDMWISPIFMWTRICPKSRYSTDIRTSALKKHEYSFTVNRTSTTRKQEAGAQHFLILSLSPLLQSILPLFFVCDKILLQESSSSSHASTSIGSAHTAPRSATQHSQR